MELNNSYLINRVKSLEKAMFSGLPDREKIMLSIFQNMTDNISVWACRGSNNNFEIVFWSDGAEKIYGYKSEFALGKNCTDLFMCEAERHEAKSDIDRIIAGTPYQNMVAHDVSRSGVERIIITNTFRIEDFERDGQFLQAEIGIDVTNIPEFKNFKTLHSMHLQISSLTSTLTKFALVDEMESVCLDARITLIFEAIQEIFLEEVRVMVNTINPLDINSSKLILSTHAELLFREHEIGSLLDRMHCTTWHIDRNSISVPLFNPISKFRIGFLFILFPQRDSLFEWEKKSLELILTRIGSSIRYAFVLEFCRHYSNM